MEINDVIDSDRRQREKVIKQNVIERCQLGYIIASDIYNFFKGDGKVIRPWDLYPDLFEEEYKLFEAEREEKEFEAYKERKRAYAKAVNEKRKEV